MNGLHGKNILVGVTGGIAVYKAAALVSLMKKAGATVQVVMTLHAREFVTPLTFAALSGRPVYSELFPEGAGDQSAGGWEIDHIALSDFAHLAVIVPATANFIGKCASCIADDLLSTLFLALKCPVVFVPAMNSNMYENPILRDKVNYLQSRGYRFMEPEVGNLACGKTGMGRMPEPDRILEYITGISL